MIDPSRVPDVDVGELLARFLLSRQHIRPGNGTVKHEAFIPPPNGELSVTRHRDATDAEVWEVGHAVAEARQRTLHGRGDVGAGVFVEQGLIVCADPIADNPNHANVKGWPKNEKGRLKLLALEIAKHAKLERPPGQ